MLERRPHSADARHRASRTGCLVLLTLMGTAARAGTAMPDRPPALGQHTLLAQPDGLGTRMATTASVVTQASGSSLLVLVGGYADNAAAPTDSYANRWQALGRPVAYNGFEGRFNARAFVALDAAGGPGHTVSFVKAATPKGEITAPFIEIAHAGSLQAVAQSYPVPGIVSRTSNKLARIWGMKGAAVTVTSDSVTTTGPATLLAVWWGDSRALSMTAMPGDGFKLIEQYLDLPPESGVQCAVAVKQVAVAGTFSVRWTASPAQGAILWLFAFQSGHPKAAVFGQRESRRSFTAAPRRSVQEFLVEK